MCFSATASFAGGAIITSIGVATVIKADNKSQMPFAAVPLIFGVQQIAEGFVWISLGSPDSSLMLNIATYAFLIAAVVIWPTIIPLSMLRLERSHERRKQLIILMIAGIITSLYYGTGLFIFNINPEVVSHHIRYSNDYPASLALPAFFLYLVATLVPMFVSSVRRMYLLGILMAASCLVTGIFFREYLTSVWCFFAALISIVIFWIINDLKMEEIDLKISLQTRV